MGVTVAVEALLKIVNIRIVEEAHVLAGDTLDDRGALAAQVLLCNALAGSPFSCRQRVSV